MEVGPNALRRSLGLTSYTSGTSSKGLSSASDRTLRQASSNLLCNIENIELLYLSGADGSTLHSTEEVETALDQEQSAALTTIDEHLQNTTWATRLEESSLG